MLLATVTCVLRWHVHSAQRIYPCLITTRSGAVRDETKTQTDALMNVDEEDNLVSIMEEALEEAPRDMVSVVKRRDKELKVRLVPYSSCTCLLRALLHARECHGVWCCCVGCMKYLVVAMLLHAGRHLCLPYQ